MGLSSVQRRRRSGFTLLELMIALSIIGVLATISLPMFMAHKLRSKSAEGKTNLAAIRVAEEAYFTEFGVYITASPEPASVPGAEAVRFDAPSSDFAEIGFTPEGTVFFSYGVTANADGSGFTADAGADIDANGIVQYWGYAKPDGAGVVAAGQVGCNAAALVPLVVGPCDPTAGRSVF